MTTSWSAHVVAGERTGSPLEPESEARASRGMTRDALVEPRESVGVTREARKSTRASLGVPRDALGVPIAALASTTVSQNAPRAAIGRAIASLGTPTDADVRARATAAVQGDTRVTPRAAAGTFKRRHRYDERRSRCDAGRCTNGERGSRRNAVRRRNGESGHRHAERVSRHSESVYRHGERPLWKHRERPSPFRGRLWSKFGGRSALLGTLSVDREPLSAFVRHDSR